MLGKPWMREAILDHYQVSIYKSMTASIFSQTSTEPDLIKLAIKQITMLERETIPQHSSNNTEYVFLISCYPLHLIKDISCSIQKDTSG